MKAQHSDVVRAYRVTLFAAILNVVGMLIDIGFWRNRMHDTPPWHLVSIAASIAVMGIVFAYRASGQRWIASAAFVFSNIITEVAIWRASTPLAVAGMGWVPFQTEKLGALTVAILAPPSLWAGLVSLGIFVGSAVVHFALFDPVVRSRLLAEPWATLAYGTFALLLYFHRLYAFANARRMAESLAARRTMEHVSRMLLAVRDFSNTPLQTLYLTTALLRTRHGDDSELLERMDRSLARLRELSDMMSRYESQVGWPKGDASLDAAATLLRGFTANRASSAAPRAPRARDR